jgi:hypothetical protein
MKGKKAIEFVLEGQALEQFLNIKRAKGLKDTEVLKLIIDWYFEKKSI